MSFLFICVKALCHKGLNWAVRFICITRVPIWLDNYQSRCYSCIHTLKTSQRGWVGSLPDIELICCHVPRAFPRILERGWGIRAGYSDLLQQELWKTIWGQVSLVFCPINSTYHFFSYQFDNKSFVFTWIIFCYQLSLFSNNWNLSFEIKRFILFPFLSFNEAS